MPKINDTISRRDTRLVWTAAIVSAVLCVGFGVFARLSAFVTDTSFVWIWDLLLAFFVLAIGFAIALRRQRTVLRHSLSDMEIQQQSMALLDQLYNTVPVGLAFIDSNLRFVRINKRLARINGRTVADHIGTTIRDVLPEIAPIAEPVYRRLLANGKPILNSVVRAPAPATPDTPGTFLISYYPLRSNDGRVIGINTVVKDITEQQNAETALRESQAVLNQTQRIASMGSWAWDWHDDHMQWSESMFEITGTSAGTFTQRLSALLDIVHPDDCNRVNAAINQSCIADQARPLEYRIIWPNNSVRIVRSQSEIIHSEGGTPRLVGVLQDITRGPTAASEDISEDPASNLVDDDHP
jgi:PAS domain S-box-containing protein